MSEKLVFTGFGIEVIEREGHFFIRYDSGEIAVNLREDEVSEEEAVRAQRSERDAYEVLLACQRRQP